MIPDAILGLVGEIGVTRAEDIFQLIVRFGIDVFIPNQERDGRSGGLPFEDSGENLYPVLLLTQARPFPLTL